MGRKRSYTDEQLIEAVKSSSTMAEVIGKLGLVKAGGNYQWTKIKIDELKIDTSHLVGKYHMRGKKHEWNKKIPLDDILVENSTYLNTSELKRRLVSESIFEWRCGRCLNTEWMGQAVPLELEHKNGKRADNRIANLTLLCPNCHAQTPTYRGRNRGKGSW